MLPNCLRVCHQTLSPSGQRDGAQQGRYSLTGSNKDPMDPESVPLPSVQAWPRILPAVPFLLVCVHGIWVTLALHVPRSPFCWQTLEELLSFPLCLSCGITGAGTGGADAVSFCVPGAASPLRAVSSHVQLQFLPGLCE